MFERAWFLHVSHAILTLTYACRVPVLRLQVSAVSYYHIVLDQHEIIFAEGAATESFHMCQDVMVDGDADVRGVGAELIDIFPHLFKCVSGAARSIAKGHEGRVLAQMLA